MDGDRLQGPETARLVAATSDAERRRKIVDVFIVALLTLTAAVALLSVWSTVRATYPHAARDLYGTAALLGVLALSWYLNRRGHITAATWLCLSCILIATTFFFDVRVLDRALIVYAVPVVAAAFLLRPRATFLFAGLAVLDYTAIWALHGQPSDYNHLSVFALMAIALLAYLVAVHRNHATDVQEEYRRELERDVAERERTEEALRARERELEGVAEDLHDAVRQIVDAMVAAVELHDPGSSGHQRRVARLCEAIGRELRLPLAERDTLSMAAVLHDVGMAAVPVRIVTKPSALTAIEHGVVKQHPELARPVLERLEFGGPLADIVSEHHERLDGSGYPRGLAGAAICRDACIIAVADTAEAMMSGRPYRAARSRDEALMTLRDGSGSLYDERVVAACLRVFEQGFAFEP